MSIYIQISGSKHMNGATINLVSYRSVATAGKEKCVRLTINLRRKILERGCQRAKALRNRLKWKGKT